jgi:hypothetical protein
MLSMKFAITLFQLVLFGVIVVMVLIIRKERKKIKDKFLL